MYDFAHCLSDYIEGITHSLCTLEFEVHRPLYDWILESLNLPRSLPRQIEFARLNIDYTVISKRKLLQLVNDGSVSGWDDPRMPTLSGLRRRGMTASAIRNFVLELGVTKYPSLTEFAVLEHAVRNEFNKTAQRRFAVLRPIKVVLTNYPADQVEELERRQQSRKSGGWLAQAAIQSRAVHRERRLHGSAAAEIFPAQTGRRSAAEVRLHHQVRRGREG